MKHRYLVYLCLASGWLGFSGCSSVSKMASNFSESRKSAGQKHNPEQMRIATETAGFQPLMRVDYPQFAGLQTPLTGNNRQRSTTAGQPLSLPRFTPVKVLSNNGHYALVQIKNGQRGFIPSACIATESAILASAKPATPVRATGPSPEEARALYLPSMDAADAPVDQAMLNNIDSIPLPESEKKTIPDPEAQEVDGVVLRTVNTPTNPADQAVGAN